MQRGGRAGTTIREMRRIARADGLDDAALAVLVANMWVEADPDLPFDDDLRVR